MHWEKHDYELPRLPKGYVWKVVIDTSKDDNKNQKVDRVLTVDDRSIVVLEGCRDTENAKAVIIKNKVREGDSAKTTKVIKKVGTTKKKTMVSKTIKTTKEEKASKAVKTKRISKNNGKV
jgi:hypothetical protein